MSAYYTVHTNLGAIGRRSMKYRMVKQLERVLVLLKMGIVAEEAELDACLAIIDREIKILHRRSDQHQENLDRAATREMLGCD